MYVDIQCIMQYETQFFFAWKGGLKGCGPRRPQGHTGCGPRAPVPCRRAARRGAVVEAEHCLTKTRRLLIAEACKDSIADVRYDQ